MGNAIFVKFSGFVGGRGPRKTKSKNWESGPQFLRGEEANFLIGPARCPLVAELY